MLGRTSLRFCFIIFLIWISNPVIAQNSNSSSCVQTQAILEWLQNDTVLQKHYQTKEFKFQIDTLAEYSKAPTFWLVKEYMAGAKGKNLKDINFEEVDVHKEYLTLYKLSFSSEKLHQETIKCLNSRNFSRGNIYLSFRFVNDVAIEVLSSKIQRGFQEGVDLLFLFDKENRVIQVFRHEWVE